MNPQGSCCLGNVRRAVEEAKAKLNLVDQPSAAGTQAVRPDCCASTTDEVSEAPSKAPSKL